MLRRCAGGTTDHDLQLRRMNDNALIDACRRLGLPYVSPPSPVLTRRTFVGGLAAAFALPASGVEGPPIPVIDHGFWRRPRQLWLKRLETGEEQRAVYWADGDYVVDGYVRLCWLLRDVSANQAVQMDPTLLNVLTGIQAYYAAYDIRGPLIVTSGYRTPRTNASLVAEGAARNSMHLMGGRRTSRYRGSRWSTWAESNSTCMPAASGFIPRNTSSTSTPAGSEPGEAKAAAFLS